MNRNVWFLTINVISSVISGVVGAVYTQSFYKPNLVAESKMALVKENISLTTEHLNKLKDLVKLSYGTSFFSVPRPSITKLDIFALHGRDTVMVNVEGKEVKVYEGHPDLYENFIELEFYQYPREDDKVKIMITSFVMDKGLQKQWFLLANDIEANKYKLNPIVKERFEDMCEFLKYHPFPKSTKFGDIKNSNWDPRAEKKWEELNSRLLQTISDLENLRVKAG